MAVKIGSARIDERGKVSGGAAGDQTGTEVSYQNWYLHSKGWVVIRAKDENVRKRIAYAMKAACDNNKIGYDQGNRSGLYNIVKSMGWDSARCNKNTETDCSGLVRVCVAYAIQKPVSDFNTSSELKTLMKLGIFDSLTDDKYTRKSDYLLAGDILVTKTKGHTVVVITDGPASTVENSKVAKPTLKKGRTGDEVRKLQQNLNTVIGANLKADGVFGTDTENAVKKFQIAYGLTDDGIYGANSYNTMAKAISGSIKPTTSIIKVPMYTLRKNSRGTAVKELQICLNAAIGANLKADGIFGNGTENAVKEFQKKYGLGVDGIYGAKSYNKMKYLFG